MKRVIIYVLVLAALLFVPVKGADIGRLRPVEVVHIYQEEGQIVIATDTGDFGIGKTGRAALEDLKATTPGTIYLDTAEYLLFSKDAENAVAELRDELKRNVKVCMAEGQIDLALAADFLPVRGKLPKLKSWNPGANLPQLKMNKKRLILS